MAIQQSILDRYNNLDWGNLLRGDLGDAGKLDEVKPNLDRIKNVFEKILHYPIFERMKRYNHKSSSCLQRLKPFLKSDLECSQFFVHCDS